MIVALAGLPGSGKSTLARALALALPATVLDKDAVRHALFGPRRTTYSAAQDDFVVGLLLEAAAYLLRERPTEPVLLDGRTFSRRSQLAQVATVATSLGVPLHVIECACRPEVARARLAHDDAKGTHPATNRIAAYGEARTRWERIPEPKLLLDTEHPLDLLVRQCLDYLQPTPA